MAARKKKTTEASANAVYPQTSAQRATAARRGYDASTASDADVARIIAAEERRVRRGRRSA